LLAKPWERRAALRPAGSVGGDGATARQPSLKNCSGRDGPGVGQPKEFGITGIVLTMSFFTTP
jgi:hypothetical protein